LSDSSIARGASVLVDAISASFETTPEVVHEVTDLYRRSGEKLRVGKSASWSMSRPTIVRDYTRGKQQISACG
jgi:hypothetical protein